MGFERVSEEVRGSAATKVPLNEALAMRVLTVIV